MHTHSEEDRITRKENEKKMAGFTGSVKRMMKTRPGTFGRGLMVLLVLFLCLTFSRSGSAGYSYSDWNYWSNRRITFETEDYTPGQDMNVKVSWTASTGSSTPSISDFDQAFSLSFSGMNAVGMLDDDGDNIWNPRYKSENVSTLNCYCNFTIPAQYLEKGELTIHGYFNGTNGSHTITIPDYDEPPAPVLATEKTEILIGEDIVLNGEISEAGHTASNWFAIRTPKGGKPESVWFVS